LQIGKTYGFDGIPNECLQHLQRRPLMHLTHLLNHCLWLLSFSVTLEGSKNHNSAKNWQRPKIIPELSLISHLSTTGKLFEKLILRTVQHFNV
jgi:hypothetical protein